MADTATRDAVARELIEKMDALAAGLSPEQQTEVTETVKRNLEELLPAAIDAAGGRKYNATPEPGGELAGTKYARLGMSEIDVQFLHGMLTAAHSEGFSKRGPPEELSNLVDAITKRVAADEGINLRAMDTTDTSSLIGAQYVSTVWDYAMQQAKVAPLIQSFTMTDKTGYIPVFGAPPVPLLYSESTQDDSADYTSQDVNFQRVTVTASKFGLHQKWSGEMEEESIIPFLAAVRKRQTDAIAFYGDDVLVNGDTTIAATGNINSDDAQLASNNRYTAFDGIRHAALVDNTTNVTNAAAALTYTHLIGLRNLCLDTTRFQDWSHPVNPNEFVYLVNPGGEVAISDLDELITVDKYGPNAVVLAGEVARIGRNPLISTMAVPQTEADGKVSATASNNTLDQVVAFNTNAYSVGYLRRMTVEAYRRSERDQNGIILFWRMGLARYTPTGAASGMVHTAVIRNI